jgi:hypothetical protein
MPQLSSPAAVEARRADARRRHALHPVPHRRVAQDEPERASRAPAALVRRESGQGQAVRRRRQRLRALEADNLAQRKGVALEYGKH